MPMDYRSHYAGDFETHLDLLAENVQQQKQWARDFRRLWIGIAAYQLYDAEREPLVRIRGLLRENGSVAEIQPAFDKVAGGSRRAAPDLQAAIAAYLREPKSPGARSRRSSTLPRERASGLLPARAADAHARAGARPGRRGCRDLLRGRAQLGRPVGDGGGVLRPIAADGFSERTRSTTA